MNYNWGDVHILACNGVYSLYNIVKQYYVGEYCVYQGIRLKTVDCLLTSLLIINSFDTFSITGDLSKTTKTERGLGEVLRH